MLRSPALQRQRHQRCDLQASDTYFSLVTSPSSPTRGYSHMKPVLQHRLRTSAVTRLWLGSARGCSGDVAHLLARTRRCTPALDRVCIVEHRVHELVRTCTSTCVALWRPFGGHHDACTRAFAKVRTPSRMRHLPSSHGKIQCTNVTSHSATRPPGKKIGPKRCRHVVFAHEERKIIIVVIGPGCGGLACLVGLIEAQQLRSRRCLRPFTAAITCMR